MPAAASVFTAPAEIALTRIPLLPREDPDRSSADVRRIASRRLEEIREKQDDLQKLHDELAHLVDACKGDDRPDCPIIDFLS